MAVNTTFNPNLLSLYQTFYSNKKADIEICLTQLITDEKNFGNSIEQAELITHLAHFYFQAIRTLRLEINSSWTYYDWLTNSEYNKIMYKRAIIGY